MTDEEQKRILRLCAQSSLSEILADPDLRTATMSIGDTVRSLMSTPPAALAAEKTPPAVQGKAARRRAVIMPLLFAKSWTAYRWEQEAGVTRKVGTRYLAGKTNPSVESRKKLGCT